MFFLHLGFDALVPLFLSDNIGEHALLVCSFFSLFLSFYGPQLISNYRGMSPSETECCFKQILHGISYLHSQGVAHRDIKPENLFFDTKGHLKVSCHHLNPSFRHNLQICSV